MFVENSILLVRRDNLQRRHSANKPRLRSQAFVMADPAPSSLKLSEEVSGKTPSDALDPETVSFDCPSLFFDATRAWKNLHQDKKFVAEVAGFIG